MANDSLCDASYLLSVESKMTSNVVFVDGRMESDPVQPLLCARSLGFGDDVEMTGLPGACLRCADRRNGSGPDLSFGVPGRNLRGPVLAVEGSVTISTCPPNQHESHQTSIHIYTASDNDGRQVAWTATTTTAMNIYLGTNPSSKDSAIQGSKFPVGCLSSKFPSLLYSQWVVRMKDV